MTRMAGMSRWVLAGMLMVSYSAATAAPSDSPLPLENRKSGISIHLSGTNGRDWAVEQDFADPSLGDQVIYMKKDVAISLAHNANNTIMKRNAGLPGVIGVDGPDGKPNSGDEGAIHWKIDRDLQSHFYTTATGQKIPDYAPAYTKPIKFGELTYDGGKPVLGSVGDNGGEWGATPGRTSKRFAYGQKDAAGNEFHTLTYWDDDGPIYKMHKKSPHRQGASDGHRVCICVDPKTPVLQFHAAGEAQYYTTPIKTYHVPKIWPRTTYVTPGVALSLLNITNDEPIYYRIGDGKWTTYAQPLEIKSLGLKDNAPTVFETRLGENGPVLKRTLVLNPAYPGEKEKHGYLLWANDKQKAACVKKLKTVRPFSDTYKAFSNDGYFQGANAKFGDARGGWRSGASMASASLNNAFVVAVDGVEKKPELAALAKTRLMRLARLEPVGFENGVSFGTPSKDYLNELSQTLQLYADAAIAYDLLAACYRASDAKGGMTPIDELWIRDAIAEIAKSILQYRGHWSFTSGSGDTHWAHGYEMALGIIAAAMPSYSTPYFGYSGATAGSKAPPADADGKHWNPFPDQSVSWYAAATDPAIKTPGHPNVRAPRRAEFLLSDSGWWTGPNDLVGDGDRYYKGPMRRTLVDVKHGGMANAQCLVEIVEMGGYEAPFVMRLQAFEFIRRQKSDASSPLCVKNYIRRRQISGVVRYKWDNGKKIYTPQSPQYISTLYAFNSYFPAASLPAVRKAVGGLLDQITASYSGQSGDASIRNTRKALYSPYMLALCWTPEQMGPEKPNPSDIVAPIIRPMFKYVCKPGQTIAKPIRAMDLNGRPVSIEVLNLPKGAKFDAKTNTLTWTPDANSLGVHVVDVVASNGIKFTKRPFPIIVMADPSKGPIPAPPSNVKVAFQAEAPFVTWTPSAKGRPQYYVVYKDGLLRAVVPAGSNSWIDNEPAAGSHTRYHVSLYDAAGHESVAAGSNPPVLAVPTKKDH